MKDQIQCAKCGSEKIMKGLRVLDHMSSTAVGNLSIELPEHPKDTGIFIKLPTRAPLHANVCGNCGYVELLAPNPEELWEIYCQYFEEEDLTKAEEEFAKCVAKDEEEFAKWVAKEYQEEFAEWVAKDPARSYLSKKEHLSLYRKFLSNPVSE